MARSKKTTLTPEATTSADPPGDAPPGTSPAGTALGPAAPDQALGQAPYQAPAGEEPRPGDRPVVIAEPTADSSLEHDGMTGAPDGDERRAAGGAEEAAEPPAPAASAPAAAREARGSGFGGGLLGGALAAAAALGGLYAARPDLFAQPAPAIDLSPIDDTLAEQAGRLDAIDARIGEIAALPAAQADPSAIDGLRAELADRVEALAAEVESNRATLDVLEGRVAQVEARPPVMAGDAETATAEVMAEMRAALDAQRAEIDQLADQARERLAAAEEQTAALRADAAASAQAAVARAALSRLQAALDAGGPFAGAIGDLSGATQAPIPDELLAAADTGVPTLADLRASFPEAARAALDASIRAGVDPTAGPVERIGAFLRTQTGARSTVPRQGEDPDALLSRAEAALAEGRLAESIGLIDGLPEPGREAMGGWRAAAEARLAALAAADALAVALSEN